MTSPYHGIATDLDGTLLDSNSKLSSQNINSLIKFKENGGTVVIATGRWRDFTVDIASKIPNNTVDYLVVQDGGLILERGNDYKNDGWTTLQINMPTSINVARAISLISTYAPNSVFGIFPLSGQNMVSSQTYMDWLTEEGFALSMFQANPPLILNNNEIETLLKDTTTTSHISWLRILPGERGTTGEQLLQILQPIFDNDATQHGTGWDLKVSDWKLNDGTGAVILKLANVNKAFGLRQLATLKSNKVNWENASNGKGWITFGDNWNDLEMLEWSELSVCPSNSPKDKGALEAAKVISKLDNDQSFVADVIETELAKSRL